MYPSPTNPTHVVHHNRGYGYAVSGVTGTIAAALAANSLVFALYCAQQAGTQASQQVRLYLDRLRLAVTTIAAFTGAITAGRSLGVYRATAGATHALPAAGTLLGIAKKSTTAPASQASATIATTVLLTPGTIVREANPIAMLDLVAVGAAGGRQEMVYELAAPYNAPIDIGPDEMLVVSNPNAMDAGGTWQLSIDECHWIEQTASAFI